MGILAYNMFELTDDYSMYYIEIHVYAYLSVENMVSIIPYSM